MSISIDSGSRKLIKNLVVVFGDGATITVPDDAVSFDPGKRTPTSLRADVVIPVRFGRTVKTLDRKLAADSPVKEIAVELNPAKLIVRT